MYIKNSAANVEKYIKMIAPVLLIGLEILGMRSRVFSFAALLFCFFLLLYCDEQFNLALLFFMVPFAAIFKTSSAGTSFLTYFELVFVIFCFVRKHDTLKNVNIFLISLVIYILFVECLSQTIDIKRSIKFISNMLLLGIIVEADEAEYDRIFKFYIIGFILSGLIGRFGASFLPLDQYIKTKISYYGDGTQIYRFAGLYTDPNYFAINLIICSLLAVYLYKLKKIRAVDFCVCTGMIVFLIAATGSKSAVLMMTIPVLTFLWISFKREEYLVHILVVFILCVLGYLVYTGTITLFDDTFRRFSIDNGAGINQLTTGRLSIWDKYMNYFGKYPGKIFIGNGIGLYTLEGSVTHNTYLDLLYQFGIIGTVLYFSYILSLIKKSKVMRSLSNFAIWICIAIMYFFVSQLQEFDLPFQIGLAILCLYLNLLQPERKTEKEQTIQRTGKSKYIK